MLVVKWGGGHINVTKDDRMKEKKTKQIEEEGRQRYKEGRIARSGIFGNSSTKCWLH